MLGLLRGLQRGFDGLETEAIKISRLGRVGPTVMHSDLARAYDGIEHSHNTSVKQNVSIASRLSRLTIEAIGTVTNIDFSHGAAHSTDLNENQFETTKKEKAHKFCSLLKSFL